MTQASGQQSKPLKVQAVEAFKAEHFPQAVALLKQALSETPDDPEVYYLLGVYTHYNAYDSRPLVGYDHTYSRQVFEYLDKALELKPDYGDAKYFYGAECSANAFNAMQSYDATALREAYRKAFDRGAYPEWLLELGRNRLGQCERDAILFAGGNPDFDVSLYLQLHENLRTDITVIPVGYIDRPWYVAFLKRGLAGAVRSIPISLTFRQIEDIHPFKWDTTVLDIPVPQPLAEKYGMARGTTMRWSLEPDYIASRNKQENSDKKRTMLSPQRAIMAHIVETNGWQRPIYFSRGTVAELMGGLDGYTQDCGLVARLLPIKTTSSRYTFDFKAMETLIMTPGNLAAYPSITANDLPRISGTSTFYHTTALALAKDYAARGDTEKLHALTKIYRHQLCTGLFKAFEDEVLGQIAGLTK